MIASDAQAHNMRTFSLANIATRPSHTESVLSETVVSSSHASIVIPTTVNVENKLRPDSVLTSQSSRDSVSTSVFSKRTSVTTKPSNESFESDHSRLVDTLDLALDFEVECRKATGNVSCDNRRVASMPILSPSTTYRCDKTCRVSGLNQASPNVSIKSAPSTPIRTNTAAAKKHLTPIIEVQTPVQSSPPKAADIQTTTSHNDQTHTTLLPTQKKMIFEQWADESHLSLEPIGATPPQQPQSSWSDDSHATTKRQRWTSKFKMSMKAHVQSVSKASKQRTRQLVQSTKKLGGTVRYLMRAARDSRSPFEKVAHA